MAPALEISQTSPLLRRILPLLARFWPTLSVDPGLDDRALVRDPAGALEPALASLPAQIALGFTTFCIKPSQFVDDLALYPAWCREVVERVAALDLRDTSSQGSGAR